MVVGVEIEIPGFEKCQMEGDGTSDKYKEIKI
jgi:hypothetical protein